MPTRLYKFISAPRVTILETGLIRFTQPSALNDPFEFRLLIERMASDSDLESIWASSRELIEDSMREKFKTLPAAQQRAMPIENVIEFLRANPAIIDGVMAEQAPIFKRFLAEFTPKVKDIWRDVVEKHVGILSLSETISQPLLWAHYADSHRGLALEFDSQHPFFSRRRTEKDELYHLRKVVYANRTTAGRTLLNLTAEDLLLTKTPEWSYEQEWRMLVPLSDATQVVSVADDTIHLFALPPSAITAVVLGARSSAELRHRVAASLPVPQTQHINLQVASLDPDSELVRVQGR